MSLPRGKTDGYRCDDEGTLLSRRNLDMGDVLASVARLLGAPFAHHLETIQPLWSGYGLLFRAEVGTHRVVVKWVSPPATVHHPRGYGGDISHARKLRS